MNKAATAVSDTQLVQDGVTISLIELVDGMTIGNDANCDVQVIDAAAGGIRRAYCVTVKERESSFRLIASGYDQHGVLINNALFSNKDLVIGDNLQLGPCHFRFDGAGVLHLINSQQGGELLAYEVEFSYIKGDPTAKVLHGANLYIPKGNFVGIIGPSGAGKTTLLKAACGLLESDSGKILVDGNPLPKDPKQRKELIGYVPQDDIVHSELTIDQALHFAAKIRLEKHILQQEVQQLIDRVLGRLFFGYEDRDFESASSKEEVRRNIEQLNKKRISTLSGGQRKRVSVAVELISRPLLLFLDEPSSGLDPVSETELMKMLRDISNSGCSIVCTTHVLENLWRMHSFALLDKGKTVFQGSSTEAKQRFKIDHLSEIYSKLNKHASSYKGVETPTFSEGHADKSQKVKKGDSSVFYQFFVLIQRQLSLFFADWQSAWLFFGQPVLIGVVLNLVAAASDSVPYKLFFSLVVVFWFGCNNSAAQIVRERAIVKRELAVGLNPLSYISSKLVFFSVATTIQAVILWLILAFPIYENISMFAAGLNVQEKLGSFFWQSSALFLISVCATAVGLALSSWAKKTVQATFLVPLIIIPQILFAGFVFPLNDWKINKNDALFSKGAKMVVGAVAKMMPCSSGQRIMETSLVWGQPFDDRGDPVKKDAFSNLRLNSGAKSWEKFEKGEREYRKMGPIALSALLLSLWISTSIAFCWLQLKRFND